jgi:hypothetical protein
MKHLEHYVKYKTTYPPLVSPLFSKRNWWRMCLITLMAVMIGPLIIYKNQRSVPFSLDYYLKLSQYFLIIVIPFVALLLWINWRESVKRNRGYSWIGKFEVVDKRSILAFCYIQLANVNTTLKVKRSLFDKIRIGDYILIRRDSLGNIEEIKKANILITRLARAHTQRTEKKDSKFLRSTKVEESNKQE